VEAPPRLVIPELAISPAQRELWRRHFADKPAAEIAHLRELEEARRIIDRRRTAARTSIKRLESYPNPQGGGEAKAGDHPK
jgi:hypothetical protein